MDGQRGRGRMKKVGDSVDATSPGRGSGPAAAQCWLLSLSLLPLPKPASPEDAVRLVWLAIDAPMAARDTQMAADDNAVRQGDDIVKE
ncbi:hypothetical protein CDD83_8161 [Cordyceps sp. RAO-2017]|nr:hypothetical protein CDD83_8161 [Cordyceps sp. RAO-2017]